MVQKLGARHLKINPTQSDAVFPINLFLKIAFGSLNTSPEHHIKLYQTGAVVGGRTVADIENPIKAPPRVNWLALRLVRDPHDGSKLMPSSCRVSFLPRSL